MPRLQLDSLQEHVGSPSPEYWDGEMQDGVDLGEFGTVQKRVWQSQNRFLHAFAHCRQKTTSARFAGVNRETARLWERDNYLGFRRRLAIADEMFCDSLEFGSYDLISQLKAGQSPIMYLAALNANLPEKYRPNAIAADDSAKELLAEIRKLGKRKLQPAAVEGNEGQSEEGSVVRMQDVLRRRAR